MLPAAHRLTDAATFRTASRRGRRASSRRLVTHLWCPEAGSADDRAPRVGFVVSRAVGNAVVRNRVQRRLRHLMRPRVEGFPAGSVLVIRALAPAAGSSSAALGADLERCLDRLGLPAASEAPA